MHHKNSLLLAAIATAFCCVSSPALATFVDHRTAPGAAGSEVQAVYKSIAIDDLAAAIVPSNFTLVFEPGADRKVKTSVNGFGSWDTLFAQAAAKVGMKVTVVSNDQQHTVRVAPVAAASSADPTFVNSAPRVPPVSLVPIMTYAVRANDGSVSRTVARWANDANMQMVWEPEDVDYPVRGESVMGNDIRSALSELFISLKNAPTPLRVCIHNNKPQALIRVIRAGDKCQGES